MVRPRRKAPPAGPRVALDPGAVRVGVATSDPESLLAVPVATVRRGPSDLDEVASLIVERDAVAVYVGLPRSLSGEEGMAAHEARRYAVALARRLPGVDVRLVDERLTTVLASRGMSRAGASHRQQRESIDAVAASALLQHVLDAERAQGTTVGESVDREAQR